MDLSKYFKNKKGLGILATNDLKGNVDIAVYSKPSVTGRNTVMFSMLNRLSYANICSNPHAAYMFIENGEGYTGKRFYLIKIHEETDPNHIKALKKEHSKIFKPDQIDRHLVYFTVDKIRPLVGDEA
jgi:hypothetical protein